MIYWYNIQIQETTPDGGFNYTGNAGNAVSKGIEFEFNARPAQHLTINFAGSVQDAYLTKGATVEQQAANQTLGKRAIKLPEVRRSRPPGHQLHRPAAGADNWKGTSAADVIYRGEENAYFGSNPYNVALKPTR